jgi:tRNA modification GTPase
VFSTSDTIVAIATPAGRGGIGVVRVSGPDAPRIAAALTTHGRAFRPRLATMTYVRAGDGEAQDARTIDQVVLTHFPAPGSYTGDDVVEISAHGTPVVLRAIVSRAMQAGARLAEPGEFTLRAYLNGRLDLMQAEAVADLIEAVTPLQARTAFDQIQGTLTRAIGEIDRALFDLIARLEASVDFPEEGYHFIDPGSLADAIDGMASQLGDLLSSARRGRLVREGLQIAIVGPPNVGKSSLFNALAGAPRAIVTDSPGTTRDLVTETVDLEGLRVTLIDTAGLRQSLDPVEEEGVSRARSAARSADLVLLVNAGSTQPSGGPDKGILGEDVDTKTLTVQNKVDVDPPWTGDVVSISARTGEGLDLLRRRILDRLDVDVSDPPAITNLRHIALVERARDAVGRARAAGLTDGRSLSEEFVLADLQDARAALEEVTGKRVPDDVLAHIFSRFCVGK